MRALVRPQSRNKLPADCLRVSGNALDRSTFMDSIQPADTFVHLVGVAHPSPAKAAEFRSIDLVSVKESVLAAKEGNVGHFIYVSVAQPAPFMQAFQSVRSEGERLIQESGMNATFVRPWYVLGPGHYWPYLLKPLYWIGERVPVTTWHL